MMKLKFMSTFDFLYSFNLCLMDLGCPLLRGSYDRRLRAATVTFEIRFMSERTGNAE